MRGGALEVSSYVFIGLEEIRSFFIVALELLSLLCFLEVVKL